MCTYDDESEFLPAPCDGEDNEAYGVVAIKCVDCPHWKED